MPPFTPLSCLISYSVYRHAPDPYKRYLGTFPPHVEIFSPKIFFFLFPHSPFPPHSSRFRHESLRGKDLPFWPRFTPPPLAPISFHARIFFSGESCLKEIGLLRYSSRCFMFSSFSEPGPRGCAVSRPICLLPDTPPPSVMSSQVVLLKLSDPRPDVFFRFPFIKLFLVETRSTTLPLLLCSEIFPFPFWKPFPFVKHHSLDWL